ncbi:hypothetical protein SAMN05661080_00519 [Modestobacter sp. DSM 44400]|nr:hypothetical protein SAMN05661080_00519 [Modestobacter sp. DSM 44400]
MLGAGSVSRCHACGCSRAARRACPRRSATERGHRGRAARSQGLASARPGGEHAGPQPSAVAGRAETRPAGAVAGATARGGQQPQPPDAAEPRSSMYPSIPSAGGAEVKRCACCSGTGARSARRRTRRRRVRMAAPIAAVRANAATAPPSHHATPAPTAAPAPSAAAGRPMQHATAVSPPSPVTTAATAREERAVPTACRPRCSGPPHCATGAAAAAGIGVPAGSGGSSVVERRKTSHRPAHRNAP